MDFSRSNTVNLFSVVTAIRAAARVMGEDGRVRTKSRNRLDACFLNLVTRTQGALR